MQYYEIEIVKTFKGAGRRAQEDYQAYDTETLKFNTVEEVKTYLQNTYGNCKKEPMYQDDLETGQPELVGYIYCYKSEDPDRSAGKVWTIYNQDWVTVYLIKAKEILIK